MSPSPLFPNVWGPPAFVLDVSVPLRWLVVSQGNRYSSNVLSFMSSATVAVPSGWPHHFAETVCQEERAAFVTAAQVDHFLSSFRVFSVAIDTDPTAEIWGETVRLSRTHKLSVWDAQFLELAHRLNLPLATDDTWLSVAATAERIPIFTP